MESRLETLTDWKKTYHEGIFNYLRSGTRSECCYGTIETKWTRADGRSDSPVRSRPRTSKDGCRRKVCQLSPDP